MKTRCILLFISLFLLQVTVAQQPSKEAVRYFEKACRIIKKHYYYADSVDFSGAQKEASALLQNATTTADTYPAIRKLFLLIKANHSGIFGAKVARFFNTDDSALVYPSGKWLDPGIGYLKVPQYIGPQNLIVKWADSLISQIYFLNKQNLKGWIIDLRKNGGGAQYPMLAGLAPFIPDGLLFFSKNNKWETQTTMWMINGRLTEKNNKGGSWITLTAYKNDILNKLPVAVLIDSTTGSSAERAAFGLHTNPLSKFFGGASAGLLSGNQTFLLDDGAMIYLTTSLMADKNGNKVSEKIEPDYFIKSEPNNDHVLAEAKKWILQKSN